SSDLRGAATMSGRRAKSFRGGRGEQVSGRRATVSNGGQRAEEKKVEERNRAFGGRPRSCCESYPSPPNAERAPRSSFGRGERVPFIEPFSPPPLDPPSPVARSRTPPSPRALFTRVLDVSSSSQTSRTRARRFSRSATKRAIPSRSEAGSRWASFRISSTEPPVRQRSSQSGVSAYSSAT